MLVAGSLAGDDWAEPVSLARTIETEMIASDLLSLEDEQAEATESRRKTFIAISSAIVQHLRDRMEIQVPAGAVRDTGSAGAAMPPADRSFAVVGTSVSIAAGSLRASGDIASRVPATTITLTGAVR